MRLLIKNMNKKLAKDILEWKYDAPYDIYNNELTEDGMKELLSGSYFALFDEAGELFGFFAPENQHKSRREINMALIWRALSIWGLECIPAA